MKREAFKKTIDQFVLEDGDPLTYIHLSKHLCVPADDAKQMLFAYWKEQENGENNILPLFSVCGIDKSGTRRYIICSEEEKELLLPKLSKQISIHIYSLQRSLPPAEDRSIVLKKYDDFIQSRYLVWKKMAADQKEIPPEMLPLGGVRKEGIRTREKHENLVSFEDGGTNVPPANPPPPPLHSSISYPKKSAAPKLSWGQPQSILPSNINLHSTAGQQNQNNGNTKNNTAKPLASSLSKSDDQNPPSKKPEQKALWDGFFGKNQDTNSKLHKSNSTPDRDNESVEEKKRQRIAESDSRLIKSESSLSKADSSAPSSETEKMKKRRRKDVIEDDEETNSEEELDSSDKNLVSEIKEEVIIKTEIKKTEETEGVERTGTEPGANSKAEKKAQREKRKAEKEERKRKKQEERERKLEEKERKKEEKERKKGEKENKQGQKEKRKAKRPKHSSEDEQEDDEKNAKEKPILPKAFSLFRPTSEQLEQTQKQAQEAKVQEEKQTRKLARRFTKVVMKERILPDGSTEYYDEEVTDDEATERELARAEEARRKSEEKKQVPASSTVTAKKEDSKRTQGNIMSFFGAK